MTADRLVALSRWVNAANSNRSPDALLWIRLCKPAEEAGEVISALHEATGANPRKDAVEGLDAVVQELLDTAVAALAAVEHVTGHAGRSLDLLDDKIKRVHRRAVDPGACARCGCTDEEACAGGCFWAGPRLCSACLTTEEATARTALGVVSLAATAATTGVQS